MWYHPGIPARIGTEFAGYRIEAVLGRGGSSTVYRAQAPRLGVRVALKILNANAAQDMQRADRALNTQYAATMGRLSPASRTLLRTAQRTWISFRDQQCRFEASGVQGGSAYPMVHSTCIARLTTERTRQLRALSQCQEGDLSCPR